MTYAAETTVSPDKSRAEIERTLHRYGATSFGYFNESDRVIVVFEAKGRRIRFDVPMPSVKTVAARSVEKQTRARWRGLVLCIKAKLESVEAGIESFEEAFLAHVVLPDGMTVAQHTRDEIKRVYDSGEVRPLLASPKKTAA